MAPISIFPASPPGPPVTNSVVRTMVVTTHHHSKQEDIFREMKNIDWNDLCHSFWLAENSNDVVNSFYSIKNLTKVNIFHSTVNIIQISLKILLHKYILCEPNLSQIIFT